MARKEILDLCVREILAHVITYPHVGQLREKVPEIIGIINNLQRALELFEGQLSFLGEEAK